MGEVKGWGNIVHPVSNRCTSFSFHINRTNHSWNMSNRVFYLVKANPKFQRKFNKKSFQQNSWKILSGNKHDQRNISTKFSEDWWGGSHFILQISKFLFINATAVTVGQVQRKVIQNIFPDLYFLCPKYVRFSSNGFDMRSKFFAVEAAAETNWKHKVIPDWGDLKWNPYWWAHLVLIMSLLSMKTLANMDHVQYLLRWCHVAAILQVWLIIWKSDWLIVLTISSDSNYVPNEHEHVNQYDPYAIPFGIMAC